MVLPVYGFWVCRNLKAGAAELTTEYIIRPEPLTKDVFQPFGDVLETREVSPQMINSGQTQKFGNLAEINFADGGHGQISIYRSRPIKLPFKVRQMECHPLGSQAFYPLHLRPFPVVVAPKGAVPGPEDIRVFLTNGHQGINLHPGVWHHYQLTLGLESDYVVFDRNGDGDNELLCQFDEEILLVI